MLSTQVDDGVSFDAASVVGTEISVESAYIGVRVSFNSELSGMILRMQIDVGFGDAVIPEPYWLDYPVLLDSRAPRLLGYPAEATLAEKLHAIVVLGLVNSRMKDYYDLWTAARLGVVSTEGLAEAIRHTFQRRQTAIPESLPLGLTEAFSKDRSKHVQWAGFIRKAGLKSPSLKEAVETAAWLAEPAFAVARAR